MSIDGLRSFLILAEQLHFGRAAQALHLTQPALTKQINRLEEAVGGKLLARNKQGTKLTTLGERFRPRAREIVAAFDQLLSETRREAEGRGGRLRIGSGSYTLDLVPRLIVKLRAQESGIEVSLRDLSTVEQIAGLQKGQLDLGFTRLPLPAAARDLAMRPVMSGQLALTAPTQRFATGPFKLADCREQPFVILSKERSPGLYELTMKLCAQHGFHPRIVQEVSELATALALVRAGMGLLIIPDCFWNPQITGVRMQRLSGRTAAWAVGAVWRREDTNPVLHRFLKLLQAEKTNGSEPKRTEP
jgi:DNA-binding transcriptional LysR family regulator